MTRTQHFPILSTVIIAISLVVGAGCGLLPRAQGDQAYPIAVMARNVPGFCDLALELSTALNGISSLAVDPGQEPVDVVARATTYYADELQPVVDQLDGVAPRLVVDDVRAITTALRAFGATGDFAALDHPELAPAKQRMDAYVFDGCSFRAVGVTAFDHRFEDVPAGLLAGPTAFRVANRGGELHELVIARLDDQSADPAAIVALEAADALGQLDVEGATEVAPGATGHVVVDLQPGRYVVACFVPGGTVNTEWEGHGPTHASTGMWQTLTVT